MKIVIVGGSFAGVTAAVTARKNSQKQKLCYLKRKILLDSSLVRSI